jgi:hypothetical protein
MDLELEIKKLKHTIFKLLSIQETILELLDTKEKDVLIKKLTKEYESHDN